MAGDKLLFLILASLLARGQQFFMVSNYKEYPGVGRLRYSKTLRTWGDASRACLADRAHLAVANSEDELATLRDLVGQAVEPYTYAHVGYQEVVGDAFFGDDGSLIDGDSFKGGGPTVTAHGQMLCPVAGGFTSPTTGGLKLDLCSTRRPYICEREPSKEAKNLIQKAAKGALREIRALLFD